MARSKRLSDPIEDTEEAYCDYKGYVPQPGATIARESIHTLTPEKLWDKYISKRRPVVIQGFPQDEQWNADKWTDLEHLDREAGHVPVKIEPVHSKLDRFGTSATRKTVDFGDFLETLQDPKQKGKWYLTTQYDSESEEEQDDDSDSQDSDEPVVGGKRKRSAEDSSESDSDEEHPHENLSSTVSSESAISIDSSANSSSDSDSSIILNIADPVLARLPATFRPPPLDPLLPSPTHALVHEFPPQPEIMGNLVLQQTNLWLGNSAEGKSSGLHHDFHDNLYALISGRKRFLLFCPPAYDYLHPRGNVERVHQNGLIEYTPRDELHVDHPLSNRLPVRPDGLPPSEAARWRLMARRKAVEEAYEEAANSTGESHLPSHRRKGKARMTDEQEAALRAYEQSIEEVVRLSQLEDDEYEEDDDEDDEDLEMAMSEDAEDESDSSNSSDGIDQEAVFYDRAESDESQDDDEEMDSDSSDSDSDSDSAVSDFTEEEVRELVFRAQNGDEEAAAVLEELLNGSDNSDDSGSSSSEDDSEDESDDSASSSDDEDITESALPEEIKNLARKARSGDEEAGEILSRLLESDSENTSSSSDDDDDDVEEDEEITSESDSDSDSDSSSSDGSTLAIPRRKGQNLPGGLRRDDGEGESDNEYDDLAGAELLLFDDPEAGFAGNAGSDDDDYDLQEENLAALAPGLQRSGITFIDEEDAAQAAGVGGRNLSELLDEEDSSDSSSNSDDDDDEDEDSSSSSSSEDQDVDDSQENEDSSEVIETDSVSSEDEEELKAAILAHLDQGGQIVVDDNEDDDEDVSSSDSEDSDVVNDTDEMDTEDEEELKEALEAHLRDGGDLVVDDEGQDEDEDSSEVIETSDLSSDDEDELKAAILAHLDKGGQIVIDDDEDEDDDQDEDDEDESSGVDSDLSIQDTDDLSKKDEKELKAALLAHLEAGGEIVVDDYEGEEDDDDSSISLDTELAGAEDSEEEEAILQKHLDKHHQRKGALLEAGLADEDDSEDSAGDSSMNTDEAEAILGEMVDAGHDSQDGEDDEEDSDSGSDSTESDLFPREAGASDEDEDEAGDSTWEADEDDLAEGEAALARLAAQAEQREGGLGKFAPSAEREDEEDDEDKEPLSFSKIDPSVLHSHFGLSDTINGKTSKKSNSKRRSGEKVYKPRKRCPEPLVVDLKAGEMLYLPASWWHEVTSEASKDDVHMALNWWFHPPDNLSKSTKSSRRAGGGSGSGSSNSDENGFKQPYKDSEVWNMIRNKVHDQLSRAETERKSYAEAMKAFEDDVEREVRRMNRDAKRGRQSSSDESSSEEEEEKRRFKKNKKART